MAPRLAFILLFVVFQSVGAVEVVFKQRAPADVDIVTLQQQVAEQDIDAMFTLAERFHQGQGVERDLDKAVELYRRAAVQGHTQAQFNLGNLYYVGEGVPQDSEWALTYYRQAAQSGHELAASNMAEIYRESGMEQANLNPAPTQASLEAPAGTTEQTALTEIQALPVPRESPAGPLVTDEQQAIELAREHGIEVKLDDHEPLATASTAGAVPKVGESRAPSAEVAERSSHVIARETLSALQARAASGDTAANLELAERYVNGNGVDADDAMAITYYRYAARLGSEYAIGVLEQFYAEAGLPMPDLAPLLESVVEEPSSMLAETSVEIPATAADQQLEADVAQTDPEQEAIPRQAIVAEGAKVAEREQQEVVTEKSLEPDDLAADNTSAQPSANANQAQIDENSVRAVANAEVLAAEPDPALESASAHDANDQVVDEGLAGAIEEIEQASLPEHVAKDVLEDDSALTATTLESVLKSTASLDAQPSMPVLDDGIAPASTIVAENSVTASVNAIDEDVEVAVEESTVDVAGSLSSAVDSNTVTNDEANLGVAASENSTLGLSQPSAADELALAEAALANGELELAVDIFTRLAQADDPQAQAHLGYLYYVGEGVAQDREEAVNWYERAAVQGDRDAQYNLAVAYAFGEGVSQDDSMALQWYRRAAEQGLAIAQYSLGVSYAFGEGVERDQTQAVSWYRAAAERGYAPAQYRLGYCYRSGLGVAVDERAALEWFAAAAANGHASAQYSLGYMYRSGKGVEQNLEQAVKWYRLAAAQGHDEARADLASLHSEEL